MAIETEIEAKFLDVDHDTLRAKLRELGAVCVQPMRDMRRTIYDFPDGRLQDAHSFVRVRDEGDKVTLSYKQSAERTVHGTKEVCLTVDSFAAAGTFLEALGMKPKARHETRRESWLLGDTQIELDEWPWVPCFAEIEAADEATLWEAARRLDLDPDQAIHGTAEILYTTLYDVTDNEVNLWADISFGEVPDWLEKRRRPLA